jgi:Zn-dependent protease with chaperone function
MKDFFERQESARRKSGQLIFLFAVAVILITLFVYFAVTLIFYLENMYNLRTDRVVDFWDPARIIIVAGITILVILGGSFYKIRELRGGGYHIAEMLGGRLLSPGTTNHEEKRLLNIVEEMAIASCVSVPDTYVLEEEGGINAFAVGFGINDGAICVTRGGLSLLSRDELQGVVAHEFSHISNSDTLINIRLMGWLHGILLISLIGQGILRGMGRIRGRGSFPVAIFGIVLYILGSVGMFFGKLIKSAVSRQREYLADASAVQFTRNPSGLAGALKKIGGLTAGSRISHPRAMEVSHMYFSNGFGESWLALMATHPPLIDRIRRIEPSFSGLFPRIKALPVSAKTVVRPAAGVPKPAVKIPAAVTGAAAMAILETVGTPMSEHAEMSRKLISDLPGPVKAAMHEPPGACALIYVLLLDRNEEIRQRQLTMLRTFESEAIVAETEKLLDYVPQLTPQVRLPVVKLAAPALRGLSGTQYDAFKKNIDRLAGADEKLSRFEYILRHVLLRHLDARFLGPKKKVTHIYGIRGVVRECSCVLSLLAHVGHGSEEQANAAFTHGKKILMEPKLELDLLNEDECTLEELDKALNTLATTSPLIKKKLLAACLECLAFDKAIKIEEVELFRAVADALDCPVPPWLSISKKEGGVCTQN